MTDWRKTWAFSFWVTGFDEAHGTTFFDNGAPDEVHDVFAARMEEDRDFWMGEDFGDF